MKPLAIIVDIDGTLAHMNGRSPYDYTKVLTDVIDVQIKEMVAKYYRDGIQILVVSGRKEECMRDTILWLHVNGVEYHKLYMRKTGDDREDSIIKREIYEKDIEPNYIVGFVLDDRNRVVKMWREIGLKCLQVAEGDF